MRLQMRILGFEARLRSGRIGSCRGVTLLELLVALTLSAVVMASMLSFFIAQVKLSRFADTRIEAVQRVRFAADMLRREIAVAGSGIPSAQPMVVYAGPRDLILSADLASSMPGDRVAVYELPGAPVEETEGADSASMILPNGKLHPQRSYGPDGLPGPAETIWFSFVEESDGRYALTRSVNGRPAEVLLRGIDKLGGRDFFSYEMVDPAGGVTPYAGEPIWHEAPNHGSAADTANSARADSVKLVRVAFTLQVRGRGPGDLIDRTFSIAVGMKNAGLIHNASCGDPPKLAVVPDAQLVGMSPPTVKIVWNPAEHERSGEEDVIQYNLYRRELAETVARPIASIPPNAAAANYVYEDKSVEPGKTYVYSLAATDCTPEQSSLAHSPSVDVPGS